MTLHMVFSDIPSSLTLLEAVASDIFDRKQKLIFYNKIYVQNMYILIFFVDIKDQFNFTEMLHNAIVM
jgi:hypothetical protein